MQEPLAALLRGNPQLASLAGRRGPQAQALYPALFAVSATLQSLPTVTPRSRAERVAAP